MMIGVTPLPRTLIVSFKHPTANGSTELCFNVSGVLKQMLSTTESPAWTIEPDGGVEVTVNGRTVSSDTNASASNGIESVLPVDMIWTVTVEHAATPTF